MGREVQDFWILVASCRNHSIISEADEMTTNITLTKSSLLSRQYYRKYATSIRLVFTFALLIATFALNARSLKEEKDPFQLKVEAAYKKVVPCLRLGGTLNGQYPLRYTSDLEEHYYEMLNITAQYRGLPPHNGSGSYRGYSLLCLPCKIEWIPSRKWMTTYEWLKRKRLYHSEERSDL